MTKESNIVYGLALGDALAFRVEAHSHESIVSMYGNENFYEMREELYVSDDTTMSLYLIEALNNSYKPDKKLKKQLPYLTEQIALSFLDWYVNPDCLLGRGRACKTSLATLLSNFENNDSMFDPHSGSDDYSKGSGTVMRTPWLGVLHAKGLLGNKALEKLCDAQSMITHRNLTAVHAAYLVARIVSALYTEDIKPGDVRSFAEKLCREQSQDAGWDEILDSLQNIDKLPKNYFLLEAEDFDPSAVLGFGGTAYEVLTHAIAFVDMFGSFDPVEVLKRSMFTSGDSDTIGAIAGAMIGATTKDDIWDGLTHILEDHIIGQLDDAVGYLEQ